MPNLDEYLTALGALSEADKKAILNQTKDDIWIPNPGPQTQAYFSKADILLYGGQGGGGKSDLLAGLALTQHKRSLLLRYQYTDLGAMIERTVDIVGSRKGLNSQPPAQLKHKKGIIDFGAASSMEKAQTWQGNPHDLIGVDEGCQFQEDVVRFLLGWNRAADETLDSNSTQRVRTIIASNPPLASEGEWIIGMFRPWLDPTYSNPAKDGELRWYIIDPDGKDIEVDDEDDVREFDGKKYLPRSRTFISASLSDNPFLIDTGYQSTLDALPEPMRSAIRDGNFMAAREDDEWQVIPTNWVLHANERWKAGKGENAMTALGLDIARGGRDQTVLSPRYGLWFDHLICVPGSQTPDGPSVVGLVVQTLRDGACINLDAIGVGSSVQDHIKAAGLDHVPINSASKSTRNTIDGNFGFLNKRSEMWWGLREALDPDYGIEISLPPDPALQADLTTPRYEVRPGELPKICVESKKDIKKRLGRSTDKGDSVVYAWSAGEVERMRDRKKRRANAPTRTNNKYRPHRAF